MQNHDCLNAKPGATTSMIDNTHKVPEMHMFDYIYMRLGGVCEDKEEIKVIAFRIDPDVWRFQPYVKIDMQEFIRNKRTKIIHRSIKIFNARKQENENMSGYFKNVKLDLGLLVGDCVKCGEKMVNIYGHLHKGCQNLAIPVEGKTFVGGKFKIHALKTANNPEPAGNSTKFYPTFSEAVSRAESYVQNGNGDMVIYKAIKVVSRQSTPIVVTDID